MATKYTYDPVKAAQVSSLIKSGIDEEEAFKRVGIPEDAYGAYLLDAVPGSPTEGQVIKNFGGTVTVYSEDEERAIAAAGAKRAADEQAARDLRNQEIAAEREKNLERLKQEREAEKESAKKGWVDEEEKAETAGPATTRTTSSVVTTGGAERVTKMTPEMSDWTDKKNTAYKQDQAATDAAREDFYRSKGLEGASRGEKLKALTTARNSGEFTDVTTAQDAVGTPPAEQYTTETIQPNLTGEQTPNDGTQTPEQAAKSSASGQTAEQQVANTETVEEQPLSDKESKNANATVSGANDNQSNEERPSATGNESNSGSDVTTPAQIAAAQGSTTAPAAKIPTNILHDYTNSTYRITLFLLTADDYQQMADSPNSFEPKRALISTGGGFSAARSSTTSTTRVTTPWGGYTDQTTTSTSGNRHPDFLEDFFIENLSITTVIGLNAKSKASNAIEISFAIIEPYGMSLLDRLMSACQYPDGATGQPSGTANYIEQPYLLQIDFMSDVNESQKSNVITSKRVAIRITELKIKPGSGGTEYKCRAIPFNHSAFQQTVAAVPINLSINASTVGEYFDSQDELSKVFAVGNNIDVERTESELNKWINEWNPENPPTEAEINAQREKIKSSVSYSVKSLPAAYNAYMSGIGKGKKFELPPNLINIVVDPTISKSRIVDETRQDTKAVPLTETNKSIVSTITGAGSSTDFKKTGVFNVHAGTDIPTLIDRVLMSSEYIKNQVDDFNKSVEVANQSQAATNFTPGLVGVQGGGGVLQPDVVDRNEVIQRYKFLDWYKIVPQVYLNGFDKKANAWSKVVCYSIIPYRTANAYHPDFKKTKIIKSKLVREYNYLYTGLNQDIVSFDIDFDSTYFTSIGTFQAEKIRGKDFAGADIEVLDKNQNTTTNAETPSTLPISIRPVNNPQQESAYKSNQDPKDFSVASLSKSIYTSSRGDMLNIKLKIIGDPAFIKQDDIYYNPMSPDYKDSIPSPSDTSPPVNPVTGQIVFDAEQVFVGLNVKNAVDIDDSTGIVNKQVLLSNGRYTNGAFSGVYKITMVRSEFSKGKFEQTLDLIRMPDDLIDNSTSSTAISSNPSTTVNTAKPSGDNNNFSTSAVTSKIIDSTNSTPAVSAEQRAAANGPAQEVTQPSDASQQTASSAGTATPTTSTPTDSVVGLSQLSARVNEITDNVNTRSTAIKKQSDAVKADSTLPEKERLIQVQALRQQRYDLLYNSATELASIVLEANKIRPPVPDFMRQVAAEVDVIVPAVKDTKERLDAAAAQIASLGG